MHQPATSALSVYVSKFRSSASSLLNKHRYRMGNVTGQVGRDGVSISEAKRFYDIPLAFKALHQRPGIWHGAHARRQYEVSLLTLQLKRSFVLRSGQQDLVETPIGFQHLVGISTTSSRPEIFKQSCGPSRCPEGFAAVWLSGPVTLPASAESEILQAKILQRYTRIPPFFSIIIKPRRNNS